MTTKLATGGGGGGDDAVLKIGLVTDTHYADADDKIGRFYRESLLKMREAADTLRREKVHLAIEIGDLIDTAPFATAETETAFLRAINAEFRRIGGRPHYVLGNHCVAALTKTQFLKTVGQRNGYYSFDKNGIHVVVLDACFRRDGTAYDAGNFYWRDTDIPPAERAWLEADLKATTKPTVVFVHQRLDLPHHSPYAIRSSREVRGILEASGKVTAVFQGHSHQNDYRNIAGIHYVVLAAMVEGSGPVNSGYSLLTVYRDGSLLLTGFRRHADHPVAGRRLSA